VDTNIHGKAGIGGGKVGAVLLDYQMLEEAIRNAGPQHSLLRSRRIMGIRGGQRKETRPSKERREAKQTRSQIISPQSVLTITEKREMAKDVGRVRFSGPKRGGRPQPWADN